MIFVLLVAWLVNFVDCQFMQSLWSWQHKDWNSVYNEDVPHPRTQNPDSCGSNNPGFVCPHMNLFSTDMLLAATFDGYYNDFLYATAGSSSDSACGRCFQVKPLHPERVWNESLDHKQLIIQNVNTGPDVMQGQFDILMGAGGMGVFNGCSSDCKYQHCSGGPCVAPLYGGTFDKWNPHPWGDPCFSGGLSPLNTLPEEKLWEACQALTDYTPSYKNQALWQSCFYSNILLYHQNFISADVVPVKCPEGLVRLTGLRRTDEADLPAPHLDNQFTVHCRGDASVGRYCITTVEDCQRTSCSWPNKGSPDPLWSMVDVCCTDGLIAGYTQNII